MAYSRVQIYNMALMHLGISASIQSTNQEDTKTRTFNRMYEIARDKVLKDFDWNFARAYRTLSSTGNTPLNTKYQYEYNYPNDCIAARVILPEESKINFELCIDALGERVINTNISTVTLRYTKRVEKEAYFTPGFADALSWNLASLSAIAITGSTDKAKFALQMYTNLIQQAMVANANEGYEDKSEDAPWHDARFK